MQETLKQLSELNNDAAAETSRTAQRLMDDEWVAIDGRSSGKNSTENLVSEWPTVAKDVV